MGIDNREVIDAVGTDPQDGAIILMMFDGWDWGDEFEHLKTLQEKLNLYFEFVETGQIQENYPASVGQRVRIDIIARLPMPEIGVRFLVQAAAVAEQLDMTITHRIGPLVE